ncbi:MAG TPA: hypothetical protein VFR21_12595, partial [Bradyrhizobium sp.]|nr:hypothetical protein [Bradyrhizobium sp.]
HDMGGARIVRNYTYGLSLPAEVPELGTVNRHQVAALVGVAPINRDGVVTGTENERLSSLSVLDRYTAVAAGTSRPGSA